MRVRRPTVSNVSKSSYSSRGESAPQTPPDWWTHLRRFPSLTFSALGTVLRKGSNHGVVSSRSRPRLELRRRRRWHGRCRRPARGTRGARDQPPHVQRTVPQDAVAKRRRVRVHPARRRSGRCRRRPLRAQPAGGRPAAGDRRSGWTTRAADGRAAARAPGCRVGGCTPSAGRSRRSASRPPPSPTRPPGCERCRRPGCRRRRECPTVRAASPGMASAATSLWRVRRARAPRTRLPPRTGRWLRTG